jgi:hypothetical protein
MHRGKAVLWWVSVQTSAALDFQVEKQLVDFEQPYPNVCVEDILHRCQHRCTCSDSATVNNVIALSVEAATTIILKSVRSLWFHML